MTRFCSDQPVQPVSPRELLMEGGTTPCAQWAGKEKRKEDIPGRDQIKVVVGDTRDETRHQSGVRVWLPEGRSRLAPW